MGLASRMAADGLQLVVGKNSETLLLLLLLLSLLLLLLLLLVLLLLCLLLFSGEGTVVACTKGIFRH